MKSLQQQVTLKFFDYFSLYVEALLLLLLCVLLLFLCLRQNHDQGDFQIKVSEMDQFGTIIFF
jgi:hypothetical protein